MGDLKPISHKQFNEFIKGRGFKGENDYKLKELNAKFGFKPMYDKPVYDRNKTNNPILNLTPENITQHSRIDRTLIISSEDMEPTTFNSLRKAAIAIGVGGH